MKNIDNQYLDGTYLKNNSTWHIEDSPWKAGEIEKAMTKNNIKAKYIAEIGCGGGEILKQLSTKYPEIHFTGYELSKDAFNFCLSRSSKNLKYFNMDIEDHDNVFDVLLCIDVFEHVEDYMGFLKKIRMKAEYKIFHIPLDISVVSIIGLSNSISFLIHTISSTLSKECLCKIKFEARVSNSTPTSFPSLNIIKSGHLEISPRMIFEYPNFL
jgi:hypothetical protein